MAYDATKMRRIEGTPGNALYIYKQATDNKATMHGSGYFDDAVDDFTLTSGDIIITCDTATPTLNVVLMAVSAGVATVAVHVATS